MVHENLQTDHEQTAIKQSVNNYEHLEPISMRQLDNDLVNDICTEVKNSSEYHRINLEMNE